MSPRRNWDSPNPSLARECAPPPRIRGRAHSPAGEGLGVGEVPIPTTGEKAWHSAYTGAFTLVSYTSYEDDTFRNYGFLKSGFHPSILFPHN